MSKLPKIIIVDDDQELGDLLKTALENEDFAVQVVDSPPVHLSTLDQANPNLLLVDIWLYQTRSGLRLAQNINQHHRLRKIPLILMSSDGDLPRYADQVQAISFFQKPFELEQVLAQIKRILHWSTRKS